MGGGEVGDERRVFGVLGVEELAPGVHINHRQPFPALRSGDRGHLGIVDLGGQGEFLLGCQRIAFLIEGFHSEGRGRVLLEELVQGGDRAVILGCVLLGGGEQGEDFVLPCLGLSERRREELDGFRPVAVLERGFPLLARSILEDHRGGEAARDGGDERKGREADLHGDSPGHSSTF